METGPRGLTIHRRLGCSTCTVASASASQKRGETGPVQHGTMRGGMMGEIRPHVVRQSRRQFVQSLTGVSLAVAGGSLAAGCTNQVAPFFSSRASDQLE